MRALVGSRLFFDVHGNECQYAIPASESITDVHMESGNYSVSVIPSYYVMANTMITESSKDCS